MSLDFYLTDEPKEVLCRCADCGNEHTCIQAETVFDRNITHNLGKMAAAAGIYEVLWHPNDHGYTHAKDIIEILENGLTKLKAQPVHFSEFNAPNGWGLYEHFVPFVEECLAACKEHPDALVRTST